MITIVLHPIDGGITYDVSFEGDMLARNVLDPEIAAAWVLHERGFVGPFQTTDKTGRIRMTFPSIEGALVNGSRRHPVASKAALKRKKGTGVARGTKNASLGGQR